MSNNAEQFLNSHSKRINVFIDFAKQLKTLSKCTDKQTAAIIIDRDATQIYSIGINGGPKGGLDCLCTLGGKYTCVHSEAQAIAKCNSVDQHKVMICTYSPCITCATLIVNTGFDEVIYIDAYKDLYGVDILRKASIRVSQAYEGERNGYMYNAQ